MAERDGALVQRVLDGDRSAFEALVAIHIDRMQAIAGAVIGDQSAVDDIVQESFLRGYRSLGSLSKPSAFPSWMYRIVHNEAVSWLRRNRRKGFVPIDHLELVDPEERLTEFEKREKQDLNSLEHALGKLRPAYREILALKYEAGLSYDEIADTLGISTANVEKKLYRARQKLVRILGPVLDEH